MSRLKSLSLLFLFLNTNFLFAEAEIPNLLISRYKNMKIEDYEKGKTPLDCEKTVRDAYSLIKNSRYSMYDNLADPINPKSSLIYMAGKTAAYHAGSTTNFEVSCYKGAQSISLWSQLVSKAYATPSPCAPPSQMVLKAQQSYQDILADPQKKQAMRAAIQKKAEEFWREADAEEKRLRSETLTIFDKMKQLEANPPADTLSSVSADEIKAREVRISSLKALKLQYKSYGNGFRIEGGRVIKNSPNQRVVEGLRRQYKHYLLARCRSNKRFCVNRSLEAMDFNTMMDQLDDELKLETAEKQKLENLADQGDQALKKHQEKVAELKQKMLSKSAEDKNTLKPFIRKKMSINNMASRMDALTPKDLVILYEYGVLDSDEFTDFNNAVKDSLLAEDNGCIQQAASFWHKIIPYARAKKKCSVRPIQSVAKNKENSLKSKTLKVSKNIGKGVGKVVARASAGAIGAGLFVLDIESAGCADKEAAFVPMKDEGVFKKCRVQVVQGLSALDLQMSDKMGQSKVCKTGEEKSCICKNQGDRNCIPKASDEELCLAAKKTLDEIDRSIHCKQKKVVFNNAVANFSTDIETGDIKYFTYKESGAETLGINYYNVYNPGSENLFHFPQGDNPIKVNMSELTRQKRYVLDEKSERARKLRTVTPIIARAYNKCLDDNSNEQPATNPPSQTTPKENNVVQ